MTVYMYAYNVLLTNTCNMYEIKILLLLEEILKRELESVSEWLAENRLSLHLGKTESILFGSNKRLAKCKELNITCNGIDWVGVRGHISWCYSRSKFIWI